MYLPCFVKIISESKIFTKSNRGLGLGYNGVKYFIIGTRIFFIARAYPYENSDEHIIKVSWYEKSPRRSDPPHQMNINEVLDSKIVSDKAKLDILYHIDILS